MNQLKHYKQWLPNLLTGTRIILTPIIIFLGLSKQIYIMIVFAILAALTDCIDGFLARKWNTVSELGAKLDTVADKIFIVGLSICFSTFFPTLWIIVLLEIILAICNLIFHYKSKKTETLWIGKIKTTFVFVTIIMTIVHYFFPELFNIVQGLIYVCINLQVLCIFEYCVNFYDNMHPLTVEDNTMHQQIMEDAMEQKTIVLENLDELIEQYESTQDEDII